MGHNLKDSGEHTLQFTLQDMLDQTRQNTQRKAPCLVALTGSALGRTFRLRQGRTIIGRSPDVDIQIDEDGISRRHTAVDWNDEAVELSDLGSTNGTVCNGDRVSEPVLLNDGDRIRLASTVLRFERQDDLDEAMRERLYELATKDPLTGAHNRRFLTDRLPGEWSWAIRHHNPCAVIAFDIDHFKVINDRHGHPVGDYVLRELARVVQGDERRAGQGAGRAAARCGTGAPIRDPGPVRAGDPVRRRRYVGIARGGNARAAGGCSRRAAVSREGSRAQSRGGKLELGRQVAHHKGAQLR